MDKKLISVLGTFLCTLAIFGLVVWRVEATISPDFQLGSSIPLRFGFVLIGMFAMLLVYLFVQENPIWEIGTREVVYMLVGAVLYTFFSSLLNSSAFALPSISQISLRPAIVIPVFFGYAFGPLVGFFAGAVGNIFGDSLTGFGLSPQWSVGNGLIGFVAGLVFLFKNKKKSMDIVMVASGVLVLLAAAMYLFNQNLPNKTFFDVPNNIFGDSQISFLAGTSIVIGFALVLAVRLGFAKNETIALAVIWGMFGNILGIGFAAISDIWINQFDPATAIVGEFLPAAGPNLIFAAILVPLLVVAYASFRQQPGIDSPPNG